MIARQPLKHLVQGLIAHQQLMLLPGLLNPCRIDRLQRPRPRRIEAHRLPGLNHYAFAGAVDFGSRFNHRHPARVRQLFYDKTGTQRSHTAVFGQHQKRSRGILGHIQPNFSLHQAHRAALTIELQINGGTSIQADTAAIG
ncbi:hypothetical protein D3C84_948180 [compost metagenome]